jgi:hypothetical protein
MIDVPQALKESVELQAVPGIGALALHAAAERLFRPSQLRLLTANDDDSRAECAGGFGRRGADSRCATDDDHALILQGSHCFTSH